MTNNRQTVSHSHAHTLRRSERRASAVDAFIDLILEGCLLYTSPSPRDGLLSRMPSSA